MPAGTDEATSGATDISHDSGSTLITAHQSTARTLS